MSEEQPTRNTTIDNVGESVTRMASSAFTSGVKFFNRVAQKTEEAFGTAEATPIDTNVEMLLARSELFRGTIQDLISYTERLVEPDLIKKGASRLVAFVSAESKGLQRVSHIKQLGESMLTHAQKLPANTTFWQALHSCGTSFDSLGRNELELEDELEKRVLKPLRVILCDDLRTISITRDQLMTARVDLDSLKNRVKKNPNDANLVTDCRKATSEFDLLTVKLSNLLDEFCGSSGQNRVSAVLWSLTDILTAFYTKSTNICSSVKRPD